MKSLLSTVEEEEGALGLWLTYLVTAIGGQIDHVTVNTRAVLASRPAVCSTGVTGPERLASQHISWANALGGPVHHIAKLTALSSPHAGGNFASWLSMPHNSVCLGASGAVFGLFAVAVLLKISLKFTKLLEMCILGQFVVQQVYRVSWRAASRSSTLLQPAAWQHPCPAERDRVRLWCIVCFSCAAARLLQHCMLYNLLSTC